MSYKDFDIEKLDPGFGHWFAGLVDGEGCFMVGRVPISRTNGVPSFTLRIVFTIVLRLDDADVLEYIRDSLGIGNLYPVKFPVKKGRSKPILRFWVQSVKDHYSVLIPVFDRFPLHSSPGKLKIIKSGDPLS